MTTVGDKHVLVEHGYAIFQATVESASESQVTLSVVEVNSWSADDNSFDDSDTDDYLNAYMKFDGCSHFNFGNRTNDADPSARDSYIHLCGSHSFRKHALCMEWLWGLAAKLIPGWYPGEPANPVTIAFDTAKEPA